MKKKKHKKKLNIRRIIFLIVILFIFILFIKNINSTNGSSIESYILQNTTLTKNEYDIIKQDHNSNYSGEGQKKVSNKDGYFTTFTTDSPYKKTYIEYKQNGNASWSKNTYWNDYMENSACGITALATILSGYKKNYTPEDLRNKYYPVMDYENMQNEFYESFNIRTSNFFYDSSHLSKDYIKEHLLTNRPVLICVWTRPKKNRWTTASHYMVLLASDEDDMVYISNPNGLEDNYNSSGWYKYSEIIPYIAKALFVESYE